MRFVNAGLTVVDTREKCDSIQNLSLKNGESSETRSSHVRTSTEGRGDVLQQENIDWTQLLCRSLNSERERILYEHREIRNLLELRADQASRGDEVALSRLSGAECHTRVLLEQQKDYLLSGARSELDMQELRIESADRALQDSGLQLRS